MKAFFYSVILPVFGLLFLLSCTTDIDLNAPQKDIWVVYGVLDEGDSVQYIRISRGFLIEGDAIEFAKNTDLSERGLQVSLTNGNQTYEAVEVDSIAKEPIEGAFFPFTGLYKISTQGPLALQTGETYNLEIRKGDDPDFFLSSQTTIPNKVTFRNPNRNHRPGPGGSRCLIQTFLENDYQMKFSLGSGTPATGLEARVYLDYQENGVEKTAVFGPTSMFSSNVGCTDGTGTSNRCYEFREGVVLRDFFSQMDINPANLYTYAVTDETGCQNDPADLPQALRFEVTGMDREIASYRRVNSPTFTDFNTVRRQYTNISGPEDAISLGIFGSISSQSANARLSECGEFLLSLNGVPEPEDPCSLN